MLNIESAQDCPIFWRHTYSLPCACLSPVISWGFSFFTSIANCVHVSMLSPNWSERPRYLPVGGFSHLEQYYSMGRIIPYIMENKKCVKPPTNYTNPLTFFMISQLKRASLVPPPISRSLASRLSDKCPRKRMQGTTKNPPRNRGKPWKTTSKNRETETYETFLSKTETSLKNLETHMEQLRRKAEKPRTIPRKTKKHHRTTTQTNIEKTQTT